MDRPKVGVAVVIIRDNKVLLGLRHGSHGAETWCTAGGHLEYGESFEECATRELFEETGLVAKNYELAGITNDIFPTEQKHYLTAFLYCEYTGGEAELKEPDKCREWKWFEWDKLPSPLFIPVTNLVKQGYSPFRQNANVKQTHGIYLSGSIPKSKEARDTYVDWREEFMKEAKKQKLDIIGINPNVFTYDMMPIKYFYGRDIQQIYLSDAVVVNAQEKIGIGTAQELLIAHYYKKPVIAIAPTPSHYVKYIDTQKQKHVHYTHPFLMATANILVESYADAVKVLKAHYSGKKPLPIRTIDDIETKRQEFVKEALKFDTYTQNLFK
jgi:8-oxo-dGTP diphosphatase